ncbi:MAG: elongation factor 4 [Candidatus Tectomicrobia bacterium]|uniref:Elongation factor 4 n=1 Tax=Tectimicrobiota bacterium TaxID=2528274 RepID=A0A932GPF9_UNCTE|nr:elongation factor 4 [Candidatus Tectomicrobia bacterium]
MTIAHIRNFSIIAHIDHGKSTLADRLLEVTETIPAREMRDQVLDQMDLERERGITIKAQSACMKYQPQEGEPYILNLIDTPGHVDFTYEVSRSLAACEGALLLVDAVQGVQAQTLANAYLASENHLTVIPVINKIDLPNADPDRIKRQIEEVLGIEAGDAILASAKLGSGVREILSAIIARIPAPRGNPEAPCKALIFDSWFDTYRGVVALIRMFDGEVRQGTVIQLMSSGKCFEVEEVGILRPKLTPLPQLSAGEVGYLIAGIKQVGDTEVGDTITEAGRPDAGALPGYKNLKPMVFCGLYPTENSQFESLRASLEKLRLNDSSFTYEPETSLALGFGFRCGFLGLLHMEIVKERLEREFSLSLITTAPTVVYQVAVRGQGTVRIENPACMPSPQEIEEIREPYVLATIVTPADSVGAVFQLLQDRRGIQKSFEYLDERTAILTYEIPLNEIMHNFFDRLKSLTRGYASLDYEPLDWRTGDLVKLDILVNGEAVDALSLLVPREKAYYLGRDMVQRMREVIPRQLFEVVLQAAVGSRIIARESIKALRKNVTAKCYGGDITRKRKLLEKQREGKKRMKQVGRVEIPQEAFMVLLQRQEG